MALCAAIAVTTILYVYQGLLPLARPDSSRGGVILTLYDDTLHPPALTTATRPVEYQPYIAHQAHPRL